MMKRSLLLGITLAFAGMAHAHDNTFVSSDINTSQSADTEENNRCWTGDQITGPIWNQEHAQQVCPTVCSNIGGQWTGHWNTVIWGERSVCNCSVC